MLNPIEQKKLQEFFDFIMNNRDRLPVSITIKFQHRKFEENKGFATISIPINEGRKAMSNLLESIKQTCINSTEK